MSEFALYRRKHVAELREWKPGDDMRDISVSPYDRENGSPQYGDMIARNPDKPADMWLVSAEHFAEAYEPADASNARVAEKQSG